MAQSKYPAYAAPSKLAVSDDLPPAEDRRTGMKRGPAELAGLPQAAGAPQALELRHLRYFAAVAPTRAASPTPRNRCSSPSPP